jgi:branched-chain amino acid transport system substrate-binding protein
MPYRAVLSCLLVVALLGVRGALADEVIIGASLPLSGPLASFGAFQRWGYERAVAEVNRTGGVLLSGTHRAVRLLIRDDRSDANVVSSNTETLLSRDHAQVLLGSCTPALVNAGALVAERHRIPMVTGCDPHRAFVGVRAWKYVWDLFFDEAELAAAPFEALAAAGVTTNRKLADLHDNGPDGQVVGGQLWPALAPRYGYSIVTSASFPVDGTQFTAQLADAKANGAEIVLVDATTPQAVSIRKQMAAVGYRPKVIVMEKGAEPAQFAATLGSLADGVLVGGYWDPSLAYPGARELMAAYVAQFHQPGSQHIADSYAAGKVLLAALAAAGSVNADAINSALARTDLTTVVGRVHFDNQHFAHLPIVSVQWQKGATVIVWPASAATGKLLFPVP